MQIRLYIYIYIFSENISQISRHSSHQFSKLLGSKYLETNVLEL